MCVAAAIVGAAAIGAVGSAAAGSEAAGATKDATRAAISEQQAALDQQATLARPYTLLGQSAVPQLQALLGIKSGPGGAMGAPTDATTNANTLATLQATPGYQFAKQQGIDATKNAAAASGMLLSGNTLEGLDKFSTGLADSTYQQTVGNLENVVGLGQAAAAGQAANIGNAASNISGALIGQGNTLAGIDANTIAGITKSIGNGVNNYTTMQTLAGLNNPGGSPSIATPSYNYGSPSLGTTTYFGDAPGETTYFGG